VASKDQYSLKAAIERAARNIPFENMMTVAPDDARKLADRFRDIGATEQDILAALVAAVQSRRDSPPSA
jgi:hypothetical protein